MYGFRGLEGNPIFNFNLGICQSSLDQRTLTKGAGKLKPGKLPVSFLMSLTGGRVGESLVAVPTAERLLSSVNTHVSLEITSVGEFLPTVLKMMMVKEKQPFTV